MFTAPATPVAASMAAVRPLDPERPGDAPVSAGDAGAPSSESSAPVPSPGPPAGSAEQSDDDSSSGDADADQHASAGRRLLQTPVQAAAAGAPPTLPIPGAQVYTLITYPNLTLVPLPLPLTIPAQITLSVLGPFVSRILCVHCQPATVLDSCMFPAPSGTCSPEPCRAQMHQTARAYGATPRPVHAPRRATQQAPGHVNPHANLTQSLPLLAGVPGRACLPGGPGGPRRVHAGAGGAVGAAGGRAAVGRRAGRSSRRQGACSGCLRRRAESGGGRGARSGGRGHAAAGAACAAAGAQRRVGRAAAALRAAGALAP